MNLKWIIALVVVVVIGAGAWWWYGQDEDVASSQSAAAQLQQTPPSSPKNASDNALVQDTAAIDAQLKGLSSDSANVNSASNDQAIEQSY